MTRLSTLVAAAAVVVLVLPADLAQAQGSGTDPAPVAMARAGRGSIQGLVLDTQGKPLFGAMVSALGSAVAFALTDREGRFLLETLPAGAYTVRIHHDGFVPSSRRMVEVRPAVPAVVSVTMQALGTASGISMLAAGVLPFGTAPASTDGAKDPAESETHSHSETAWRLRHLKRSVLKDEGQRIDTATARAEPTEAEGSAFGRAFESSLRAASAVFDDLAVSGEVNLVTSGAFNSLDSLWSPDAFASSSIAYVALQAAAGAAGTWSVRGAMNRGEVGSWFLAGGTRGQPTPGHRYRGGFAYGSQYHRPESMLASTVTSGMSRSAGLVYGFDHWAPSSRVSLDYGLTYAWQDYVDRDDLISPRVALVVTPGLGLRMRTVASRHAFAPGAEELVPPSSAFDDTLLLPAQRTFSAWADQGFQPQTTDHFEVAVERGFAEYVVGFRTFYQRVDDQNGALFAQASAPRPAASLGHFYVASVGDLVSRGWGVTVARSLASTIRGSVDYTLTSSKWSGAPDDALPFVPGGRPRDERVHDVTTSLETDFVRTATRVYVFYKVNSAYAQVDAGEPGFDSRFDVQVNQALPFLDFTSAQWEVLVAVRNVFHDPTTERSGYDELLVVRPPKRIVGGVRVRF
jgi:hypothetical protein